MKRFRSSQTLAPRAHPSSAGGRIAIVVVVVCLALLASASGASAQTDEGWVVRSFNLTMTINADASVNVVEDIQVDFGSLQKHGIFRYIPTDYAYNADYT